MLWHEAAGPVLCASLTEYQAHEPTCMQRQKETDACLTSRIEMEHAGRKFWSVNDLQARVRTTEHDKNTILNVEGELTDRDYRGPDSGRVPFRARYMFSESGVLITVSVGRSPPPGSRIRYIFPVVAAGDEKIEQPDEHTLNVSRTGGTLNVTASLPATARLKGPERMFNVVPGFETVPLLFDLKESEELEIRVTYQKA